MTISTTTPKSRYAGDGSTTSFPTGFKFLDNEHVRVILRGADGGETPWGEGSEYSLSGAGLPGGGTVEVLTSPVDHTPGVGETLVVKLAVPARQETSLPLGGAFPSTAVEGMADLAALRDQQIEEALSRAVKFKETSALADVAFPEPVAGKPIGWSAAGDALVNLEAIGRWQGDWQTATDYVALDVVRDPVTKNVYVCEVAHTAGELEADVTAGKWRLAVKVEDATAAQAAAEAAQAAAEAAQAGAETAAANAANSAMAASGSASTASTAAAAAQTAETNAETAQAAAEAAQAAAEAVVADGIAIVPRGAWQSGTSYSLDEGVTHQGSFWRSLQGGNQGNAPDSSPSHWELTVAKGDQGEQGIQGIQGEQGIQGIQGEQGEQGPPADTVIMLSVSAESGPITAGVGKLTFRMPHAFTLSEVRASLKTASSSGAVTVDINEGGSTILSTKLTIDQGEKTSTTAATPAVISDANLADDAEITIDIDAAGTDAAGLKVTLIGTPA